MLAALCMHGNQIGSGSDKILNIAPRLLDHQMHVEDPVRTGTDGADYRKPEGNTWHKHSVHDINMYILCPCLVQFTDLLSQS